jgi:hypothetical protein
MSHIHIRPVCWRPGNGRDFRSRKSLSLWPLLAALALVASFAGATEEAKQVREPAVAGSFYEADPAKLAQGIGEMLRAAEEKPLEGKLIGLVCPHAGYPFSGPVAAFAYKQLQTRHYDTVVLIGPCHAGSFTGASVGAYAAFKTPLGEVPVDTELCQRLIASSKLIRFLPEAHRQEHSLEVQLPFLQTVMKDFRIAPILMGDSSFKTCKEVADKLSEVAADRNMLIIASTDLSHYLSYNACEEADKRTVEGLLDANAKGFYYGLISGRYELCGAPGVVTLMLVAARKGPVETVLLKHANSGDTSGDRDRVVGYAAVAFLQGEKPVKEEAAAGPSQPLDAEAGETVLKLAREAIQTFVTQGREIQPDPKKYPTLDRETGVFVTLYNKDGLRGCIGRLESDKPLWRTVPQMAVESACHDPRFPPLSAAELKDIRVEVSVFLSPMIPIESPDRYEPGKQGIMIVKGQRTATFLPQVATEQGWNREQTLRALCQKAGLLPDAWKEDDALLFVYYTQVFEEEAAHE